MSDWKEVDWHPDYVIFSTGEYVDVENSCTGERRTVYIVGSRDREQRRRRIGEAVAAGKFVERRS